MGQRTPTAWVKAVRVVIPTEPPKHGEVTVPFIRVWVGFAVASWLTANVPNDTAKELVPAAAADVRLADTPSVAGPLNVRE